MSNTSRQQMQQKEITLAQNIRFLRKSLKLSQEELANRLGIKRSNVAAYESKNVEPRLRIILEMARLFNVSVESLISKNIAILEHVDEFGTQTISNNTKGNSVTDIDEGEIQAFIDKSIKIRKVLEGFKAFYSFKKSKMIDQTPDQQKLVFDIDNFIQLMEHLLAYNETVIKAISTQGSDLFED